MEFVLSAASGLILLNVIVSSKKLYINKAAITPQQLPAPTAAQIPTRPPLH